MNVLIHLPHNNQVLSHELLRREVEEVLDGSLALLDVSSSALDALSQMKQSILDLQSTLRRGSDDEGIRAYLASRKKIYKKVSKYLVNLKKTEKSCTLAQRESDAITVRLLKEAEENSLTTLKAVFSCVMGKKAMSQTRSWSLVSKLVKSKNVSHEAESEVDELDCALHSLSRKQLGAETKVLLKQLEALEMTILELEDDLESVSRCLVKTRVSLLNVLNH